MYIIGIDVSKNKLDCALIDDSNPDRFKFKVISNSEEGFIALIKWLSTHIKSTAPEYHFVMEATGVYHERCADWLFNTGSKVSVVNPAHIKYYGQSLGVRSKNDKKDSVVLARYGLTQKPIAWEPEAPEIRILKALASRLDAIEKDSLREKNRYEKSSINPCSESVLKSIKMILAVLLARHPRYISPWDIHVQRFIPLGRLNRVPQYVLRPVSTPHKSRSVKTYLTDLTAYREKIFASLACYRTRRICKFPCCLLRTKNHHFAIAPFP